MRGDQARRQLHSTAKTRSRPVARFSCDPPGRDEAARSAGPACVEACLQLGMAQDRSNGSLSPPVRGRATATRGWLAWHREPPGGALVERHSSGKGREAGAALSSARPAGPELWVRTGPCQGLQVHDGLQVRWLRARAWVRQRAAATCRKTTQNPAQATPTGRRGWRWPASTGAQWRDPNRNSFSSTRPP